MIEILFGRAQMGKEHKGTGWVLGGWSVAALFSVSTAVLLIVVGHWSFIQALFLGEYCLRWLVS